MKKLLLQTLIVIGMSSLSIQAQSLIKPGKISKTMLQTATAQMRAYNGTEPIGKAKDKRHVQKRYPDKLIGSTYYDLQTNNTMMQRVVADGAGGARATWTHSSDDTGNNNPDRGSGYNSYDGNPGNNWAKEYDEVARIEPERCGWPNIDMLSDGSVVIVSHSTASGRLYFSKLKASASEWSGGLLNDGTGVGQVWSRMAVGGPDGNTIHVFTSTTPTFLGGGPYKGVEGQPVYHRSLDGGETWDKQDVILPGLDSSNYARFDNDAYAIAARGNTVAIAIFGGWNDIAIWKSTDNGETWNRILVNDFPLDKYAIGTPYTVDDIGGVDTLGPGGTPDATDAQKMAVFTSDGSGYITIDANGKCHVVFGEMYLTDTNFDDQNWSYYPFWPYLDYWNEDMAGQRPVRIFAPLDYDGDSIIAAGAQIDNIAPYFRSLASFPYITSDDEGTLYLAYSALDERFNDNEDGEYYRHLYLSKSSDGGKTWDFPVDVINKKFYDGTGFEEDTAFTEAIYPSMDVDGNYLHLVFQKDFDPGLFVPQNSSDEISEQEISYLRFDKGDLNLVERVTRPKTFRMSVQPNPVIRNEPAKLHFELRKAAEVRIELYDMDGQLLHHRSLEKLEAGAHDIELMAPAKPGTFAIKIWVNKNSATRKLIVQ